jgi:hypothetical protein
MHMSTPVQTRYPAFGPFNGEALQREITREQAAIALKSTAATAAVALAGIGTVVLLCWTAWTQLAKYEQLFRYCAGV